MANIKDIAKKCGVSAMTVSRALNNSSLVTENTKAKILKACDEMGYIPNQAAKTLVTKETNMIGLVVPNIDYYYADIIKAITLYMEKRGYGLLLCDYDENHKTEIRYLYYLLEGRVDGIIFFPYNPLKDDYINIIHNKPIIFVNKEAEGLDVSFVGTNNYKGSVKITEYMINKGYKRIGVIHSDLSHKSFFDRYQGYKDTILKYGIPLDESILCKTKLLFQEGYDCAGYLISKNVDAIYVFNDVCALGVLKYCTDKGINVPNQLGVAGYDNIKYLEMFNHRLTTVDYNGPLVGETAAEILIDEIRNPQLSKRKIIMEPQIVIGETL